MKMVGARLQTVVSLAHLLVGMRRAIVEQEPGSWLEAEALQTDSKALLRPHCFEAVEYRGMILRSMASACIPSLWSAVSMRSRL